MEMINYEVDSSTSKDWFEFLLDLNLVDKHLKNENPGTFISHHHCTTYLFLF
jgi:hypothetical protein